MTSHVPNPAAQLRHERSHTPADEHQAVVEAQVLGAKEIEGVGGHQGETASVYPVGYHAEQERQEKILGRDHRGQREHADGSRCGIDYVGPVPADGIRVLAGAYTAEGVHSTTG